MRKGHGWSQWRCGSWRLVHNLSTLHAGTRWLKGKAGAQVTIRGSVTSSHLLPNWAQTGHSFGGSRSSHSALEA